MKPILQLAAVGFAGVVLFKLAALLFLPILAILFKVLLVMAVIFLFLRLIRKKKDGEAPAT